MEILQLGFGLSMGYCCCSELLFVYILFLPVEENPAVALITERNAEVVEDALNVAVEPVSRNRQDIVFLGPFRELVEDRIPLDNVSVIAAPEGLLLVLDEGIERVIDGPELVNEPILIASAGESFLLDEPLKPLKSPE